MTSRSALGVIDSRHALALTSPHGHERWKDADVVLGVGTRLAPMMPAWGSDDGLKFIRLDIDTDEINRIRVPDVAIQADAALGPGRPVRCGAGPQSEARPYARMKWRRLKAVVQREFDKLTPQMPILAAIRSALPEDGILSRT